MDVFRVFLILSICVLVNSFFLETDPAAAVGCDDGWVNANGNCYLFINTRTVTWQQAGDECATHDSTLVHFDSLEEKSWYTSFVESNTTVASAAYWTALNDFPAVVSSKAGTGVWKWNKYVIADVSLITWNTSPENDGFSRCGGVNVQGKMSDVSCDSKQGYICIYNYTSFADGCPLGWYITETSCYWVSGIFDQLVTWGEAKEKCQQVYNRATLLTLDTEQTQSLLRIQLPYMPKDSHLYWTGLQYINEQWQWFNGSSIGVNLLQWVKEPDNVAGMEHCAVIRRNGHFSDRDCKHQHNFICKKTQHSSTHLNLGCGTWTRAGQSCFKFYDEPLSTWQEARTHCQSVQGDLIHVESFDTKIWLSAQLRSPFRARKYWIGLTDRAVEGTFVWTDGTPVDSKIVVWNQEPKNFLDEPYCGVLKSNGYFEDLPCRSYKAAAICELDNTLECPTNGGIWMSRVAHSEPGRTTYDCYLFTPFNNSSALFLSSEADSYCRSLAIRSSLVPSLLSIDSATEKAFIRNALETYTDNPYGYHTSLNDKDNNGFWAFGNSTEVAVSVDWGGEPNSQTVATDCVSVNYGERYDVNTCSFKYGFICQRPAIL